MSLYNKDIQKALAALNSSKVSYSMCGLDQFSNSLIKEQIKIRNSIVENFIKDNGVSLEELKGAWMRVNNSEESSS